MSEATCAGRRFALRSTPEQPANSKQNRACRFKLRTIMVSVKGQPGSERGWGLRGCLIFRSDVIINLWGYKKHMYASTLDSPGFIRGPTCYGQGWPVSCHTTRPTTPVRTLMTPNPNLDTLAIGEGLLAIALLNIVCASLEMIYGWHSAKVKPVIYGYITNMIYNPCTAWPNTYKRVGGFRVRDETKVSESNQWRSRVHGPTQQLNVYPLFW